MYQILFRHNRPEIPHQNYEDSLVQGAVKQRKAFLESKSDRLYTIEIYWVLLIDGNYAKTGLLHAFSQLPQEPGASIRELRSLLSGNRQRKFLSEQIERDRMLLEHKVQSLTKQLSDLTPVELLGAEKAFRVLRRLVNFRPSKIEHSKLRGARHLDWQTCDSELEAHRGYRPRIAGRCRRTLTWARLDSPVVGMAGIVGYR